MDGFLIQAKCQENVGHADSRRDKMNVKPQVGLTYRAELAHVKHSGHLMLDPLILSWQEIELRYEFLLLQFIKILFNPVKRLSLTN